MCPIYMHTGLDFKAADNAHREKANIIFYRFQLIYKTEITWVVGDEMWDE